jgi:hypothetical protein
MAGATPLPRRKKKHLSAEVNVQEGAGGLLLLAAATETGLLSELETAIASCSPSNVPSLLSRSPRCRRQLVLTFLVLNLGGLRRTRDLRGETGEALGLLTGRPRADGYGHTERCLSQLARADGAEVLTTATFASGPQTCGHWALGSVDSAVVRARYWAVVPWCCCMTGRGILAWPQRLVGSSI